MFGRKDGKRGDLAPYFRKRLLLFLFDLAPRFFQELLRFPERLALDGFLDVAAFDRRLFDFGLCAVFYLVELVKAFLLEAFDFLLLLDRKSVV